MKLFRTVLLVGSLPAFLICLIGRLAIDITPYSYSLILAINIYMLLKSYNNSLLFIVSSIILYSNYSVIYAVYYNPLPDNAFTSPINLKSYVVSLNILTLFNILLLYFIRWEKVKKLPDYNIFVSSERYNGPLVFFYFIALILIFFLGFTIPEEGERGAGSSIYEYSIIIFMFVFYFSGNKRKVLYVNYFFVLMYSLQCFVFGGRVDGIQFMLCTYLMMFINVIKKSTLITMMIIAFVLFSVIGVVRGELLSGNFEMYSIMKAVAESGFTSDTAYSAYYASEAIIYMKDAMPDGEVLRLFFNYLKSIILGGGANEHLSSLSIDYVLHYGGGWFPFYFFFYLGEVGVLISAIIIALFINLVIKLKPSSSTLIKLSAVWFVTRTFRWYLYSPSPLLRGMLVLIVVYYMSVVADNFFKGRSLFKMSY